MMKIGHKHRFFCTITFASLPLAFFFALSLFPQQCDHVLAYLASEPPCGPQHEAFYTQHSAFALEKGTNVPHLHPVLWYRGSMDGNQTSLVRAHRYPPLLLTVDWRLSTVLQQIAAICSTAPPPFAAAKIWTDG